MHGFKHVVLWLQALFKASSQDVINECRIAAHTALEPLQLDASVLLPFLASVQAEPSAVTPTPKRSRKGGASQKPVEAGQIATDVDGKLRSPGELRI